MALTLGILSLTATFNAQAQRRARQTPARPASSGRTTPTTAGPAQTARPAPGEQAAQAGALAVVNGQSIMPADVEAEVRSLIASSQDPYLQAFYEDPEKEMAAARVRAVEARAKSLLLEAEAKRRNTSVYQLVETEINSHIPTPSEQEIRAVYDANRAQLGGADLETARPQIIAYLRGQVSERLYGELTMRLRMTNTITRGADPNAPGLAPNTPLVTVGSRSFTAGMLNERMKPYAYKMRMAVYRAMKQVLDKRINDLLLLAEAQRRGVPPEQLVREEITNKVRHPTEADVTKFFQENRERITGDLPAVHNDIASYLEQEAQEKADRAFAEKLRTSANFRLLVKEPDAPVQTISTDDDPARGDARSPVTIVEFTDFQCPACGAMYPVLEEALKPYGARVRFVVRDFPLAQHEFARKAAEAAQAANAQGKFFEYINLLFTHQKELDVDALKRYASQLGLDRARFDAALDAGTYAAEVQHDVEDGELYGVESTPTIYINGVRLLDLSAAGIREAIEKAFARAGQPASPARAAVK
jgi:protein-disulfide isomerase